MIKRLGKWNIKSIELELKEMMIEKDFELNQFGVNDLKVLKRMIEKELEKRKTILTK